MEYLVIFLIWYLVHRMLSWECGGKKRLSGDAADDKPRTMVAINVLDQGPGAEEVLVLAGRNVLDALVKP